MTESGAKRPRPGMNDRRVTVTRTARVTTGDMDHAGACAGKFGVSLGEGCQDYNGGMSPATVTADKMRGGDMERGRVVNADSMVCQRRRA